MNAGVQSSVLPLPLYYFFAAPLFHVIHYFFLCYHCTLAIVHRLPTRPPARMTLPCANTLRGISSMHESL